MLVPDLITMTRTDFLDDTEEPYLWSDKYLLQLAMKAEQEAARRALLLLDETNATANDIATGTATSTLAGKLVDTAAAFTSTALAKTVYNTTDNTFAAVSLVDSGTQLALDADVMASGETYLIGAAAQALTRVCVVSGAATYLLSDKVIKINNCYLASDGLPLEQKTEGWLDRWYYQWRLATGKPVFYVEKKGVLTLVPRPDAGINSGTGRDTLILSVYRLPLRALTLESTSEERTSEFEIPEEYHFDLIHGICEFAYGKQDAQGYDPNKAATHAGYFTAKFGPPVSALAENNVRQLPSLFRLEKQKW